MNDKLNLIVLGNGFDLHHKLTTKYQDFRNWLLDEFEIDLSSLENEKYYLSSIPNHPKHGYTVESYIGAFLLVKLIDDSTSKELWRDFEDTLGKLDFKSLFDEVNIPEDEDGDAIYSFYEDNLSLEAEPLPYITDNISYFFTQWITSVNRTQINFIKNSLAPLLLEFIRSSYEMPTKYLTFNYTNLLEEIYGVKSRLILHIHGDVNSTSDHNPIIVGHGNDSNLYDIEECTFGTPEYFLCDKFNAIQRSLRKKTSESNRALKEFLGGGKLSLVTYYGFSFGDVDDIYLKTIIESTDDKTCILINDTYPYDDVKESIRSKFIEYGYAGKLEFTNLI